MTPLDDELRRTLADRATLVAPSADPMHGVEARAGRLRRRRAALTVTGAAAAAALVAVAVPALVPQDRATRVQPGTTTSPTATPADLASWGYRGDPVDAGTLQGYRQDWALRHPGSTLTPLFGQVYEPSAKQELVFSADGPDGTRVGVVSTSFARAEFVYDEPLGARHALAFVLPGDETARVLVVAAPGSGAVTYRDSSASAPVALTVLAPGVATGPVGEVRPTPLVSVSRADGGTDEVPVSDQRLPGNLLGWEGRGLTTGGPSVSALMTEFARRQGASPEGGGYRALYTGDTDSGVRFTLGQVWLRGDDRANTVLFATGGTAGDELVDYGYTPREPAAVLGLVRHLPGTTVDLLVVVPRPGTGQVSYDADGTGAFRPVAEGRSDLLGIGLVDRAKDATSDRLEVLDGDGNTDHPLYRGDVATLLAGDPVH